MLAQGLGPIAVKRLKLGKGAAPMAAARAELKVLVRVTPAFVSPSVIGNIRGKLTKWWPPSIYAPPPTTPAAPFHCGVHDIDKIQTRTPRDSAGLGGG